MRYWWILLTFLTSVLMAQQPETVLRLPWGTDDTAVGLKKAPDAFYGPRAFTVVGSSILLLDSENGWLKEFRQGKLRARYAVPRFSDDFYFISPDNYLILSENTIYFYRNGQITGLFRPDKPTWIIETFWFNGADQLVCNLADGRHLIYSVATQQSRSPQPDWLLPDQTTLQLVRESTARGRIRLNRTTFVESFPENNLASLRYMGRDSNHRLFLSFEFFVRQVPLRIRREIVVFSPAGERLLTLDVPVKTFTSIFRDTYITPESNLYQMFSTPEGIEIVRWNLKGLFQSSQPVQLQYPDRFYHGIHYNEITPVPDDLPEEHQSYRGGFDSYPQIMPEEALSRGDAYVQLWWTCTPANLTNGIIMDPYGYLVQTPDWIQIGLNQRVPYKWGGFEDLEQFLYGISIGKYAGDKYTNKPGGTPSAVGVDCSGFVSRCWNLPLHYSTRQMDDSLTVAYSSWLEAEPGDAVHKVGHVRLLTQQNGNGSLMVVEASGRDWRVNYHSYYYSSLYAYTPRYYVNRQGAPGTIPQPRLDFVQTSGKTGLRWAMGGTENTDEIRIYTSADGHTWTLLTSLPDDFRAYSLTLPDGELRYFKLVSVSSETGHPESKPSDTYGTYRNGNKPQVLIVDGFDRTTGSYGKWPHIYHPFAATVGNALYTYGIPFSTVDNDALLRGEVSLEHYPAVFWILGDESTHDGTFDIHEQELVANYLKNGGKLFVSGSEIGWDLVEKGTSYDKDFYAHYLKANYLADNGYSYRAEGENGTPFQNLTLHFDNGTHGTYKVGYPDVITAKGGSSLGFRYANGYGAGIYFKGTFPGGNATGSLVYLGFPFHTIYPDSERFALMGRVLEFFELIPSTQLATGSTPTVNNFELMGNYPNPFNGQSRIRFRIPAAGQVELCIFNPLGQQVAQQKATYSSPGVKEMKVNSEELASGVYFYQMVFRGKQTLRSRTHSFIVVK